MQQMKYAELLNKVKELPPSVVDHLQDISTTTDLSSTNSSQNPDTSVVDTFITPETTCQPDLPTPETAQSTQAAHEVQQTTDSSHLPAILPTNAADILPVAKHPTQPMAGRGGFPSFLIGELNLAVGQDGKTYSRQVYHGNACVVLVGSKHSNNLIRQIAGQYDINLKKADLSEINEILQAHAEMSGIRVNVWYRVAPVTSGVEIDLGDEHHTRIRITAGKVEIVVSGSEINFSRSPISLPMVMPAEKGDLKLLIKYLNVHPATAVLIIAWVTYTLAHPKHPTSKFIILQIISQEGSGKSQQCKVLSSLIDPSQVVLQRLPRNDKDLAIAAQNTHVLFYDNVRSITPDMADILCVASTGGVISSRQLYTDSSMSVLNLHSALVLNGVHSFINQPDLAQRCLPIQLQPIMEDQRKSEIEMEREFNSDLPFILRGLFNLIADIFKHLPNAKAMHPERMIDFVRWLAAMEMVQGVPAGIYQSEYSAALREGQLDTLQENVLAAAILELAESLEGDSWHGTPEELLNVLTGRASVGTLRSKDWPHNAISLSKRLAVLEAGLRSQGIEISFRRGKKRTVTINTHKMGEN